MGSMATTVAPRCGLVAAVNLSCAAAALATCMTSLKPKEGAPFVQCNLGIEQWENGKRSKLRYQLWDLDCSTPAKGRPSCQLERTIFTVWGKKLTTVSQDRHWTKDG